MRLISLPRLRVFFRRRAFAGSAVSLVPAASSAAALVPEPWQGEEPGECATFRWGDGWDGMNFRAGQGECPSNGFSDKNGHVGLALGLTAS